MARAAAVLALRRAVVGFAWGVERARAGAAPSQRGAAPQGVRERGCKRLTLFVVWGGPPRRVQVLVVKEMGNVVARPGNSVAARQGLQTEA